MFLLRCSERTAIISPKNVNQLVFLMDANCVVCEVLIELFNLHNRRS
jgi:hypothetical protein